MFITYATWIPYERLFNLVLPFKLFWRRMHTSLWDECIYTMLTVFVTVFEHHWLSKLSGSCPTTLNLSRWYCFFSIRMMHKNFKFSWLHNMHTLSLRFWHELLIFRIIRKGNCLWKREGSIYCVPIFSLKGVFCIQWKYLFSQD